VLRKCQRCAQRERIVLGYSCLVTMTELERLREFITFKTVTAKVNQSWEFELYCQIMSLLSRITMTLCTEGFYRLYTAFKQQ
jgi:hypothetical protein